MTSKPKTRSMSSRFKSNVTHGKGRKGGQHKHRKGTKRHGHGKR